VKRIHSGMSPLLLVLAAACGSLEGKTVASLEKVPVVGFDSLFRRVDSVMLVTPTEEAIGNAMSLVVLPASVILVDVTRGNLKVFSKQGRLLKTIGKPGDGPGEFRTPMSIARDSRGNVVVLDIQRSVISTWDTSGVLLGERVVAGSWDGMAALPGTDGVLLIGGRVRKGKEGGVGGEQMALHEVDSAGTIGESYHSFNWPADPMHATFTHFVAGASGDLMVTGAHASNRVYFINRRTGNESSAAVGGPWYRDPNWSKSAAPGPGSPVGRWAKEQILLMRLFAIDEARYLAEFQSYTAEGEAQYMYVLGDTAGVSRVSTRPTPVRIVFVSGETAYGTRTTREGDVALETLQLTARRY
jgi:hypothetical protein